MKPFLLKLSCFVISLIVLFDSINAQNMIPNHSFETWTNSTKADGWSGLEFDLSGSSFKLSDVKKSTDPQDGSFAAQIISKDLNPLIAAFLGMDSVVVPGMILTGNINILEILNLVSSGNIDMEDLPAFINAIGNTVTDGIPISQPIDSLSGYYKYAPAAEDEMCVIGIVLYGSVLGARTPIAIGYYTDNTISNQYKHFSTPVIYLNDSVVPNEMIVFAIASANIMSITDGTSLTIDNFSTHNKTGVGISQVFPQEFSFQAYPNPSSGTIYLNLPLNKKVSIKIFNSLGKIVWAKEIYDRNQKIELKESGVYIIQANIGNETKSCKVIINK